MSRSSSITSRGECKNCSSKRAQWRQHLCLRHARCMNPRVHLWDPANCDICSGLLKEAESKGTQAAHEARTIVKEILHSAEATALRKNYPGFVTPEVFQEFFKPWIGKLFGNRVIRRDATASSPARQNPPSSPPGPSSPKDAAFPEHQELRGPHENSSPPPSSRAQGRSPHASSGAYLSKHAKHRRERSYSPPPSRAQDCEDLLPCHRRKRARCSREKESLRRHRSSSDSCSPTRSPRTSHRSAQHHSRHRSSSTDSGASPRHYRSEEELSLLEATSPPPLSPAVLSPVRSKYHPLFGTDSEERVITPPDDPISRGTFSRHLPRPLPFRAQTSHSPRNLSIPGSPDSLTFMSPKILKYQMDPFKYRGSLLCHGMTST